MTDDIDVLLPDGLANLDETGKPPAESRLTSAKSARAQYEAFKRADQIRNGQRAKVQGAFDGAAPYNQAMLRQAGQGSRANLNFGDAQRFLDLAVAGFVDLANSVETLVQVDLTDLREQGEKYFHEANIALEVTHAFRSWAGFYPSYLRLANTFVAHGVGFAIFPNAVDWRFKVSGFGDFFLPDNTPASPDAIDLAVWRFDCSVTELYSYIADEAVAERAGWDVDEVKKVILTATKADKSRNDGFDWESAQRRIKNGDVYDDQGALTVRLLFCFPLEFDGTRSFMITAENGGSDEFLYKAPKVYESTEQAFIPFVYGVGSNGTYHSIRGLGQRLFAHVQTLNRLRCQLVDGAMLASSMIIQPSSPDALARMQIQHLGGVTAISPGISFVDRNFSPNMTQAVVPAIQEITGTMSDKQDFYSTAGAAAGSPYRSRLQVEAELESATRLTSASLSLYYAGWTPLMREMTRRLIEGPKSDPVVREFYRRTAERGTPAAIVKLVDHAKTRAVRAIGAGNSSARTAAYNDLIEIAQYLPEDGRKNLIYDRVANRVGHDAAARYASPSDVPRPTVDSKIAELENNDLLEGTPIGVQSNELHGEHLAKHLPVIEQITAGIDDGSIDAMQVLNGLTILHEHSFTHVQVLAADPWSQPAVAAAKGVLQRAGEQILNYTRRAQAEAQEAGNAQQAGDLEAQGKEFELQLKLRMAELAVQARELEIQRDEQRHRQRMALEDAKSARGILNRAGGLTSPGNI